MSRPNDPSPVATNTPPQAANDAPLPSPKEGNPSPSGADEAEAAQPGRGSSPLEEGRVGVERGPLLSDPSQLEAENGLLRQRVALAERDLDAARKDVEGERARIASWQDAFGLHDGVDPKEKVRATIDAIDAKSKRVAALQAALGVGDEDPVPLHPHPLSSRGDEGDLSAWGRLLLLTQLAKHHPLLGASYFATPDVLQDANGDRWMALRQEALQADGTAGHVVTIQRSPNTFRYDEARTQKVHLEGELAAALRSRSAAQRGAGAAPEPAAKARLETAKTRVEEIQAALRDIEPRLTPPETQEWHFAVDLDGLDSNELDQNGLGRDGG